MTFKGSREEGLISKGDTFEAGERRAQRHIDGGRAERVEKQERPEYTDKMQRPDYTDKRRFEVNGSWKTLYEGGSEVDTVQCSKEEAEKWASGKLSLHEIQ